MTFAMRLRLLAILAALTLAFPSAARAEGITGEMVEAARAEVVPRVAKETGVDLDVVKFRIGGPDVIEAALRRELLPQARVQTETEEAAKELADQMAATLSKALYAKYIPTEKAVIVCPETIDRVATLCDSATK